MLRRRVGLGFLAAAALLSGCSTTTAGHSTSSAPQESTNVTPCNYAQVWQDNPTQFSEFPILARFAQTAGSADLRAEGRQLASAVAAKNATTITGAMGAFVATCERLGLLRPSTTTSTTKG
jgi:hypothetical protein